MKRRPIGRIAWILILALLVPTLALAADSGLIVRNGQLGAYLDGEGGLYITGRDERVNSRYAVEILALDEERVLYRAQEKGQENGAVSSVALDTFSETVMAEGVCAATVYEDALYFVQSQDRTRLMCLNFATGEITVAASTTEHMESLAHAQQGLVVTFADDLGSMLLDAQTGTLEAYASKLPEQVGQLDDRTLTLTADKFLTYTVNAGAGATDGSANVEFIDFGVTSFALLDGNVYYITSTSSGKRLKLFHPAEMSWKMVMELEANIDETLVASASKLFVLDASTGRVLLVDPEGAGLSPYAIVPPEEIALESGWKIERMFLGAMDGQVNVYATLREEAGVPAFSFSDEPTPEGQSVTRLVGSFRVADEKTTMDAFKPANTYQDLARGSRGEAVRRMQERLIELDYLDGKADGIFGSQTQYAVRLFQTDLADRGIAVNGIATAEMQRILFEETLSPYDPYVELKRRDSGLRVQILQERLRELGFLADAADGIYGARTQEAVALFQAENGLFGSGTANRDTLMALYAENARRCTSYINLEKGDTGACVRNLNKRLKELYYFEGTVGSTYNNSTVAAVKRLQAELGYEQTGSASAALQRTLFGSAAPEYSGYITLKQGDSNGRVSNLQSRLSRLGYFTGRVTGTYGSATKAAVSAFQATAGLNATGIADVNTQERLYRSDAPVAPTATPMPTPSPTPVVVGVPVIGLTPVSSVTSGVHYIATSVATVRFTWSADGRVENYVVRITDSRGNVLIDQKTTNTSGNLGTFSLSDDRIYTISVGAIPKGGTELNAKWNQKQFALVGATETPVPTTPVPTQTVGQVGIPVLDISPVKWISVDMVRYVEDGTLTLSWSATGDVDHYYVQILDGMWDELVGAEFTATSTTVGTGNMVPGEIYRLRVFAVPRNGDMDDATVAALQFAREAAAMPTPTTVPTQVPTTAPMPTPTQAPTTAPTQVPTTAPTQAPTTAPAETPVVGTISEPVVRIEPVEYTDGDICYVSQDAVLTWYADGEVNYYHVVLTDDTGTNYLDGWSGETSLNVPVSNLTEGRVYTVSVGALPVNGGDADVKTASMRFALVPAPEPTAEPTPVVGTISEPVVRIEPVEYTDGDICYVSQDAILTWYADGEVDSYHVVLTDDTGTNYVDGWSSETSLNVPVSNLTEGRVYTVSVGALPVNGGDADVKTASTRFALVPAPEPTAEPTVAPTAEPTPEPTLEPTAESTAEPMVEPSVLPPEAWTEPMNAQTDPERIQQIQNVLQSWGWLTLDTNQPNCAMPGQLDGVTLQAVYDFQVYVNQQYAQSGVQLNLVDLALEMPEIGTDTLKFIANVDGIVVQKPAE